MSLHSGLLWLADGFDKYENLPKPRVDHYKSYVVNGAGDHACTDKVSPKLVINADQHSAKSQPQQVKPSQRPNSARPPKQSSAVNTASSKKRPRSYRRCTKVTAPGDPTPRTGAWTSDTQSPRANHGPPGTNRHYCDLPTHPDLRYFDRHSRCYNNPHCGDSLTSDRPRTACSAGRVSLDQCECCGEITSMIRYRYAPTGSAMTGMNAKNKTFLYPEKLLHYDSYSGRRRPSSAPPRACNRRPPHHNYVVRGDIPHFCNFVRPCSIYDKVTKQKILEDDDLNEFILRYRAGDGDPLQDEIDITYKENKRSIHLPTDYGQQKEEALSATLTSSRQLTPQLTSGPLLAGTSQPEQLIPLQELTPLHVNSPLFSDTDSPPPHHLFEMSSHDNKHLLAVSEKASSEASLRRESSFASKNPLSKITVELFNELKEELSDYDKKGQTPQQPAPDLSSEPGADNSMLLSPRHHGSAAEISRVSSPQNSLHVPSEAQLNDVITNIQSERLSTVSIRSNKSKKQMSHHRKRPATSSSKLEKKSADTVKVMASSDKRKGLFENSDSSIVIAEPVESSAPVEVPKETAPTSVVVPSETLIADVPADDVPQQPESEAKLSTLPVKPKYTRRVASGGHDEEPWADFDQTARLNAFMRQHRGSRLKLRRDSLLMSAQVRSPLKMQAWMNGRLALSKRSSRFELPMDMRVLETMTPLDYLAKYCVVTSRRQMLYDKIYGKHRNSSTGKLGFQELQKALSDVLIQSIDDKMMKLVIQMLLLDDQVQIDKKLFHGISAFSERLLYPIFARGEQYKTETQKEKIETADFFALEWKFHGVNVNDSMRKILETL